MSASRFSYKNHRFPPQIIARAVWPYFRLPLSLRLVEEMLLERGIVVSTETIGDGAKIQSGLRKTVVQKAAIAKG